MLVPVSFSCSALILVSTHPVQHWEYLCLPDARQTLTALGSSQPIE